MKLSWAIKLTWALQSPRLNATTKNNRVLGLSSSAKLESVSSRALAPGSLAQPPRRSGQDLLVFKS